MEYAILERDHEQATRGEFVFAGEPFESWCLRGRGSGSGRRVLRRWRGRCLGCCGAVGQPRKTDVAHERVAVVKACDLAARVAAEANDHHAQHVRVALDRREIQRTPRRVRGSHHDIVVCFGHDLEDGPNLLTLVSTLDRLKIGCGGSKSLCAAIACGLSFHRLKLDLLFRQEGHLELVLRTKAYVGAQRSEALWRDRDQRWTRCNAERAILREQSHWLTRTFVKEQSGHAGNVDTWCIRLGNRILHRPGNGR